MSIRRILQHVPVVILASMLFEWSGMRFFPLRCMFLGMNFDLRVLALALPLAIFAVVIVTFRYGRVFCSWCCPTHLYLEGARWISDKAGKWRVPALWLTALFATVFVVQALVTCFIPVSDQLASYRENGLSSRLFMVHALLFLAVFMHLGLLLWRFCVYVCPYGLLMRLFKTDTTHVMRFDAASGRCVDCGSCDVVCPYELDVRKQCDSDLCTNCGLCIRACSKVLGEEGCVLGTGMVVE